MSTDAKPLDTSIGVISDDQLARVQAAFGLKDLLVLPFFSLNKSIIDLRRRTETARKVFIESEQGVLFLKELPWYCSSVEFAAFQTELLSQLHALGAPVARPLTTCSGHSFFHDRRTGSIFILQPYVEGRSWTGGDGEARAAGRALAGLHTHAGQTRMKGWPGMRDAFVGAESLVSLLQDSAEHPEPVREEIHDFAGLALAVIERCRTEAYAAGYGAEVLPVHGDFNPFNLIFGETRDSAETVVGVVDFDNACLDDRAHDLGESLVRFGWVNYRGLSSAYGAVPTGFDRSAVAAVLAGYREADEASATAARPLLPAVMTAVALELAAIGLLSAYYTHSDLPALRRNAEALPEMAAKAVASVW
ncbi:phosphotransferase enzyme family protein [Streptomyces stelliscabiei]|uniref:phosphotransferase enzyme family protein n=1 Tax=Streptomyces stelliscabiei TaxID=146820 RepID=UPI0029A093B4|nr:aminoglycoside phosphotransferase family protein [Streptomyces stelliscabiei]MDX2552814.1 aminoglycoside phosphotransferase family protein [Streptomyces stelliscabiei]MDX2613865.1 aminoglycoside phosphotransferase family protein [Streptomyces stelliscabiei]MDX2638016.1 aminoglycoside phosphotransferase family protein [Streptomyces stelliscabiei]MDX2661449.1 aminoglycoside phosphotransferase family protein [Streptomyces stelliscabiei]MDX2713106.1 aminoglycoside phosphotransferase family prot